MLLIRNLTFLKDETMVEIVQLIDGAILTKFDGVKRQLEVQISKGQPCRHLLDFFFLSGYFFTDTDDSQGSREREGIIFYSTLPLPPAHKH